MFIRPFKRKRVEMRKRLELSITTPPLWLESSSLNGKVVDTTVTIANCRVKREEVASRSL
jgi:hypothetical protein